MGGTGLYFDALRGVGRDVVGVDASADQLKAAKARNDRVVQADAAALPLRGGCCDSVVAIWLSTDVDDFERVLAEAARVLSPAGRMLIYGVHPCFNGPFVEARPDGSRLIHPGYREATWHTASPWWSKAGVRSRVGMRHVPLASLINAVASAGLRIVMADEPRDEPVPFILALVAENPSSRSRTATDQTQPNVGSECVMPDPLTLFDDDGSGPRPSLDELRRAMDQCRDCPLWEPATQAVFGEGPPDAALVLMGEVPGDKEDLQGHPFVGPAGHVLDEALDAAGIDRETVYLTNAVKHFKFERRGKVRIHKKPNTAEIAACKQWWVGELAAVQPKVLGLLGAVAAQSALGSSFRVTKQRGQWFELSSGVQALATIHPSAVLRAEDRRDQMLDGLVRDLKLLRDRL